MSVAAENVPSAPGSTAPVETVRSASWVSRVRLALAVLATLTLLPYAWGFTLVVYSRWGQVSNYYLVQLAGGILGVIVLTYHLGAKFPSKRVATGVTAVLIAGWTAVQAATIIFNNGDRLPWWIVFAGCYPATLWVVWTAWMFFVPIRWPIRVAVLAILLLAVAPFLYVFQARDLTGEGHVNFDYRWRGTTEPVVASTTGELSAGAIKLAAITPSDFPSFQGPARDAVLHDVKLARDWNEHPPRELWRIPVGAGWGGFAVVGGYAFTQEQRRDDECIVCRDLATGQEIWLHKDKAPYDGKPRYEGMGGPGPRCTPTVHEGRVYTVGCTGILDCLDGGTGKILWSRNIVEETHGSIAFHGVSGSPLIVGKLVVVGPTGTSQASLAAYDRLSGNKAWSEGCDKAAYATPMLTTVAGKEQILHFCEKGVTAHDPHNGHVLWYYEWSNNDVVSSQPIANAGAPDQVLLTLGYGKGSTLLKIGHGSEGKWSAEPLWENHLMKTKFTTAVLRDGFVYGLDDGIMQCLDVKTGKQKWKGGRFGHGQILLTGDTILVQTEPGPVVLIDASPDGLKKLGEVAALSSKTWNCPTLAGKHLLVRNDIEAVCYELALRSN